MGTFTLLLSFMLILRSTLSAPSDSSFVVSSTAETLKEAANEADENTLPDYPEIYEMDITTNISNRFAKTLVASKVKNTRTSAKEATFTVVLPKQAFISEFVMEVGGKSYKAYVKEKEEAKNIYNKAVASGQTAAHVAVSARDSNKFTVSLNVEPESKAVFLLTYEELLQRKSEQYELVLNIHPGQIIKDLHVKVNINESRPLKFVKTPSLRSGNEISKNEDKLDPSADIKIINSTTATVTFSPDSERQKQFARGLGTKESDGLSGQFVVQYEVERDPYGGEVLLQDGYFVHFFAPSDLQPLPKHILFVLDTSGSMGGMKIIQLKDAMKSILNEIRNGDKISIIEFNSDVYVWDINSSGTTRIDEYIDHREPFATLREKNLPAATVFNKDLLEKAKNVVDNIYVTGLTNIIGGLETALYLVKVDKERNQSGQKYQPIILFLTDGAPNVGLSSTDEIVNVVTKLNSENNNVPIFALSFGTGANKEFLRSLSSKNQGFSRHIYEASDASLQLQDFYNQISSPLLSGVHFEYNSEVKDVTKKVFPIYFRGSELVVAGKYKNSDFSASVKSVGPSGPIALIPTVIKPVTQLERLWAYLTVKQLLDERDTTENKTDLTKRAVDLALKYSFVTDVTSLVVVKPNDTRAVDTENAADGQHWPPHYHSTSSTPAGISGYYPRSGSHIASIGFSAPPRAYHRLSASGQRSGTRPVAFLVPPRPYYSPIAPFPRSGTQTASIGFPVPPTANIITSHAAPTSLPSLQNALPWLATAQNPNGTISIAQSVYEIGSNHSVIQTTECPKTPLNSTEPGDCVLLKHCPQVYSFLTDFQTYQRYFCAVDNKYAGICCPKKKHLVLNAPIY